jgi:dihydrofolate reductase
MSFAGPRRLSFDGKPSDEEDEMGKLVVTEFITLDGVIEDPGGSEKTEHGGWAFQFERGDEGDKFKVEELAASDAQLLGRVTYDGFAAAWPSMEETTGDFGKKMNAMPKFVVSTTLDNAEWNNTEIIRKDVPDEVARIKQQFEGDILVAGSARLAQSLFEHDLVDELHLMVYPVLLGRGKRLFADGSQRTAFELVDAKQSGAVAILTLTRAPASA